MPRHTSARDPGSSQDFGSFIRGYIGAVLRRRWLALGAFLVAFGASAFIILSSVPSYEARVRLLVSEADPASTALNRLIQPGEGPSPNLVETQAEVLKSRSLARDTVAQLQIWEHPEFSGEQPGRMRRFLDAIGWGTTARASARVPVGPVVPESMSVGAAADETAAEQPGPDVPNAVIDDFVRRVSVAPITGSQLIELKFTASDPEVAAAAANGLAATFINRDREGRFSIINSASEWLSERLAEQRGRVRESELRLQQYLEQQDAVSLDDRQNIVTQRLAELNSALTRARTERITREELYNQAQSVEGDQAALEAFPAIANNSFIQQLKAQVAELEREELRLGQIFGDRHPEMIRVSRQKEEARQRLTTELATAVQAVKNEYFAARAQEQSLAADVERQKGEALSLNRKGIEYNALRREAESNRQLYDNLLQQASETGLSSEIKRTNIQLVDAAEVPGAPTGPPRRTSLLLALCGSLLFGLGLVFGTEALDNRLKTPEDIQHHLELSFLGFVPALPLSKDSERREALLTETLPFSFIEAFRRIRANLSLLAPEERGQVLLVTSTGPKEGKTLVATNVAVALAQAGRKVVLVDGDMRRPQVHSMFREKMDPGLATVLAVRAPLDQAVRHCEIENLSLLLSGFRPRNPTELLSSGEFQELLTSLRDQYDWVVIDSPPVMAVADAAVMAREASGVLFVVASEITNRNGAQTALSELERSGTAIVGCVLNRVDLERSRHFVSPYYSKDYESYYRAPAEAS